MQSHAKTVDEYLAQLPPDRGAALSTIRNLIKRTVPDAREEMRYGMPGFTLGKMVCGFASQKRYMAFYCCDDAVQLRRQELSHLDYGKGCIRFRKLEELPLDIVADILRDVVARR